MSSPITLGLSTILIVVSAVLVCLTGCRSGRHESTSYTRTSVPATDLAPPPADLAAVTPPVPAMPSAAGADKVFDSPEAAMLAVAAAAEAGDHEGAMAIFGGDCRDLVESDDPTEDGDDCVRVAGMIREQLVFEDAPEGRKVAVVGKDGWRFPVPITKTESGWSFDIDAGREELITRDIGHNELLTVEALEEVALAQREYFAAHRDGSGPAFASRFESSDGRHDGLCWKPADGEPMSPLGPLIAAAAVEERPPEIGAEPVPFHGYFYKMLSATPGSKATESRAGRWGAVAWPAEYGTTGIKTFMVGEAGIVFEKDLGLDTSVNVRTIAAFDPDSTWEAVKR